MKITIVKREPYRESFDDKESLKQGWNIPYCSDINDWRLSKGGSDGVFESDEDVINFVIKTAKLGNEESLAGIEFLKKVGSSDFKHFQSSLVPLKAVSCY